MPGLLLACVWSLVMWRSSNSGDPNLSQDAIKQQIKDTTANIAVCGRSFIEKYSNLVEELKKRTKLEAIFVLDASKN